MKNEVLTFLKERDESQEQDFYGFKEQWGTCKSRLNIFYRALQSTNKAITRPDKREVTFVQSFDNHQQELVAIPSPEVNADYVKYVLSEILDEEYQIPSRPESLTELIEVLHHCLSYFSKNLDYIPLSTQMRIDHILMDISFFVGGIVSSGFKVAIGHDKDLSRTGKTIKKVRARRDEIDTPIIIDCLEKFLKNDQEIVKSYFMSGACKIIAEKSGYSPSKVKGIVEQYFKENRISLPFKQVKRIKCNIKT